MNMPFQEFTKIPRLSRDVVVTEKIDGTNAQVFIRELPDDEEMPTDTPPVPRRTLRRVDGGFSSFSTARKDLIR